MANGNNDAVPNLSYAQNLGTYVGQPIQEIKALNAELDNKYKTNQANSDQLEILLKNTKLDEKDNWIKDDAINDFTSTLASIKDTGNWEHAGQLVRGLGKDFATNEALNLAALNKQAMNVHNETLTKDVADGKYPQEYANFALITARENYQGVQLNEETGHFEGSYNAVTPPEYNDIAKDIYELAQKVKEDEYPLMVKDSKGNDTLVRWSEKDNGYIYTGTKEIIEPQKIANAMRNLVLTNKNYIAQMDYEIGMQKYNSTKLPDGSHRNLNSYDIEGLFGGRKEDINQYIKLKYGDSYTMEELEQDGQLDNIYKEVIMNQKTNDYIRPSEIGLSYTKVQLSSVSNWLLKDEMDYTRSKAAAAAEEAKITASTVMMGLGASIVNPLGIETTVRRDGTVGIVGQVKDNDNYIKEQNNKLAKINDQLADDSKPMLDSDRKRLKDDAETIQIGIDLKTAENKVLENITKDQYYDWLLKNGKISSDSYNELTIGDSQRLQEYGDLNKELSQYKKWGVTKGVGPYEQKQEVTFKELEQGHIDYISTGQGINALAPGALKYVKPENQEKYKKYFKYVEELYNKKVKSTPSSSNEDFTTYINEQANKPRTAAYYDFSVSELQSADSSRKHSHLTTKLTEFYKSHSLSWDTFSENGRYINPDVADPEEGMTLPIQDNVLITGITDYIEGQGYMFVAREAEMDEDNKPTGKYKEFLMKPKQGIQGTGMDEIIYSALKNDFNRFNKKGENEARYGSGSELADAIMTDFVEKQGNIFRTTSPKEGKETSANYHMTDKLSGKVTRTFDNGIEKYNLTIWQKKPDGTTEAIMLGGNQNYVQEGQVKGQMEERDAVFYDLQSAEKAIEGVLQSQWNIGNSNNRTDRHNNPVAFTTDIAKQGKLIEGVDYIQGDAFTGSNGQTYYTAKLIKDPIETTIKTIDEIGLLKSDGSPRWSYMTNITNEQWLNSSLEEKKQIIKQMYAKEGGTGMNNLFN